MAASIPYDRQYQLLHSDSYLQIPATVGRELMCMFNNDGVINHNTTKPFMETTDIMSSPVGSLFPRLHEAFEVSDTIPELQPSEWDQMCSLCHYFPCCNYRKNNLDFHEPCCSEMATLMVSNPWPADYHISAPHNCCIQFDDKPEIQVEEGRTDHHVKIGKYSVEEKKNRILRYLKKRNHRNFNKTIKYACRKTLAENRVRIRGRFAKNGELPSGDIDNDQIHVFNSDIHTSYLQNMHNNLSSFYDNESLQMIYRDGECVELEGAAAMVYFPYTVGSG